MKQDIYDIEQEAEEGRQKLRSSGADNLTWFHFEKGIMDRIKTVMDEKSKLSK